MKKIIFTIAAHVIFIFFGRAQTNTFPATGNVGIGTLSPAANLQVIGSSRFGSTDSYGALDSSGNLSFKGIAAYKVAGNKYAFQYSGDPDYGLFFNSTNIRYEFRNGTAAPIFYVDANNGNSTFNGTLKVGTYTLPVTDGANGQVLKTNGSGLLTWSNDNNGSSSQWITSGSNIYYSIGNVGIGTSAPSAKLHINGGDALINGLTIGLGTGSVLSNTAVGSRALFSNTTGFRNTANGYQALYSNTTGVENTAIGYSALFSNTIGSSNSANGFLALYSNTSGNNNLANGYQTLYLNTTGYSNTATGNVALYANTSGNNNTANGYLTLSANTTGINNTAIGSFALYSSINGNNNTANGYQALYLNSTGYNNTANGASALNHNTSGIFNTANGYQALYSNTTASSNTATGGYALYANTTGNFNTANGLQALSSNTTGSQNTANGNLALFGNIAGNNNTANGYRALFLNTSGNYNTGNGHQTLYSNTTGFENTGNGNDALYLNTTGYRNSSFGYGSGSFNDNNTYCTFIGYDADQNVSTDFINSTALGNSSRITSSNQVRIGNTVISSIGGYEPWTDFSDGRFKKTVKENVKGLEFINRLRPVTYSLKIHELNTFLNPETKGEKPGIDNAKYEALIEEAITQKEKTVYTGFIAQEVEQTAKEIGYDFNGVDAPDNKDDHYGLRYSVFVVPLVKAVQELSTQNETLLAGQARLKSQNDDLEKKYEEQQKQIDELKAIVLAGCQSGVSNQRVMINEKPETANLEQNIPNPFNNTTTVNYSLPQTYTSAILIITDKMGKALKEVNVSGLGKGSLKIDASTLSSGAYQYSLYVDGKLIDTKQMILAK